ncbi:MAG TPA: ATP-binding protein [Candidatus Saccharimonadia bacterium]|nr:ATP-binding protein [Candidatus Saccharimonadia bacterium]
MVFAFALFLIALSAAGGFAAAHYLADRGRADLERRLREAEAELRTQQTSQAQVIHTTKLASLGQMVAGVAHEINTPLGFVKSNCEVISDLLGEYEAAMSALLGDVDALLGADPAHAHAVRAKLAATKEAVASNTAFHDAKDLLVDSLEGIHTITNLVANLKGFARVDRDGLDSVDLNESIRSALTVVGHQLRDRVRVDLKLAPLPKVRCMPSQINQVFLNLLTNASQAIEGEGSVTIETREEDGQVETSFTDTGAGIPDDVLPRIFDPFFTTKPIGEGTGLGLSIVHKIVKSHGGAIRVRTAVGQGTTFTVSLPTNAKISPASLERAAA